MSTFPPRLTEHFARHHGVVEVRQLRSSACRSTSKTTRRARVIAQVHRGVTGCWPSRVHSKRIVLRHARRTTIGHCRGECCPALALQTHEHGGRRRGRQRRPRPDTGESWGRPTAHQCDGRRRRRLRPDGIRVTSPARTWFDRACELSDRYFESLTEQLLDGFCTLPTLFETARRLSSRGRAGSARVRRVLSKRSAWQRPADSELELRVLRALESYGIVLIRQYPLRLPNGVLIHLDGADPVSKWGVEVDHVTWHGGRFEAQADKARDRAPAGSDGRSTGSPTRNVASTSIALSTNSSTSTDDAPPGRSREVSASHAAETS